MECRAATQETKQRVFESPDEARDALVTAAKNRDHDAMKSIFGPVVKELSSGDPVEQAKEFEYFATHVMEGTELVREGDQRVILRVGAEKWPFPVPVIKKGNTWFFDTAAGREEILNRRIGHNELNAIKVSRAYVEAQRAYYALGGPDGDPIPKYAQRLTSSPCRKNGLFWKDEVGNVSPLGALAAKAKEEGYGGGEGKFPHLYHGYYFRVLKEQGPSAPGGRFNYVINGNMVAGYALVAYPARWGVSGVMTFIVNQRGKVYQKNLGPKTSDIAGKMKLFNPDITWKLVD